MISHGSDRHLRHYKEAGARRAGGGEAAGPYPHDAGPGPHHSSDAQLQGVVVNNYDITMHI